MLFNWSEYVPAVKKAFSSLGKRHPKMLEAYQSLGAAAAHDQALDAKTRELIAVAVAISLRCDGCTSARTLRRPGRQGRPRRSLHRRWPRQSRSMLALLTFTRCGHLRRTGKNSQLREGHLASSSL